MYKELFKKKKNSSTWRIYVAHVRIHVILHLTCLNVILNILPSCGNICISGFRCKPRYNWLCPLFPIG